MPLGRCHFDSAETMNWSMMVCAPFAKSPNCASQRQSMFGIIERIAVIETEHGRFRKQAVVNANARLFRREMQQRNVRLARFRIVKNGVPLSECSARLSWPDKRTGVPSRRSEPNASASAKPHSYGPPSSKTCAAPIEQHPFHFRQNIEILRHAREAIDNLSRSVFRLIAVGPRTPVYSGWKTAVDSLNFACLPAFSFSIAFTSSSDISSRSCELRFQRSGIVRRSTFRLRAARVL